MEHIILFGICVVIACVSTPRMKMETQTMPEFPLQADGEFFFETGLSATISCVMAVPLWVAFEVLLWVGKASGFFKFLNSL